MKPGDYKEKTIYIRQHGDSWETMIKAHGRGMILQGMESRETAVKMTTFLLWAVNEFGLEEYGTKMEGLSGAPDGVEYPVIEEAPRI